MNVEIGAEAALFPEKEYINGITVAVQPMHFHELTRQSLSCAPSYVYQPTHFPVLILQALSCAYKLHEISQSIDFPVLSSPCAFL